jgi:hypothetical protein
MIPFCDPSIVDLFGLPARARSKRDSSAESQARAAVLAALRDHPAGLTRKQITEVGGSSGDSRIGELRDAGWLISFPSPGEPYVLTSSSRSMTQGARREVVIGVKLRHLGDGTTEVKPYGTSTDLESSRELASTLEPLVAVWLKADPRLRDNIGNVIRELAKRYRALQVCGMP